MRNDKKNNDDILQGSNLNNDLTLNISSSNFDDLDIIDYDLINDYSSNTSDNEYKYIDE